MAMYENSVASSEEREKIWDLVKDAKYGFLVTPSADGRLSGRPLTTQKIENGKTLWFFIDRTGDTAQSVNASQRVLLTYSNSGDDFYASLEGTGEVIVDVAKAREMWSKFAEAWFPGGPEDPTLGLLRVDVDSGEVWEPAANKLVQFVSIATAAFTHTPPKHVGEHKTFNA
jgi:general stress protein 26